MKFLFGWLLLLNTSQLVAQNTTALVPEPLSVSFDDGFFVPGNVITYEIHQPQLEHELKHFEQQMHSRGWHGKFKPVQSDANLLMNVDSLLLQKEAYRLQITRQQIRLTGGSADGIFYGIQTLLQLVNAKWHWPIGDIYDKPAFPFRGYMIDVGRNFQSLSLIKEQIDMMAALKLNVFHFHLTEDIAWRIESRRYPALNADIHMTRNPGQYYRFEELRDLVRYCHQRHIRFIPEMDMPGHSAAFTRALGVDMQSAGGKKILKELLDEFLQEVEVDAVHIGGDEVKYKDPDFLKDMSTFLMQRGKQILSWDPGGATVPGTIHQLWQGSVRPPTDRPSIDSRHLYLNHLDPLEGVPSTFNHRILDRDSADEMALGATLCNWPDRKTEQEQDLVTMNPVLPVMMAFAERCWKGGGFYNYGADIGKPGSVTYAAFADFEKRMVRLKEKHFPEKPFPYVLQSQFDWTLFGPYPNEGNLLRVFPPEQHAFLDTAHLSQFPTVYGGTIWLRHFWHPMIRSHLSNPEDSSTWYAFRKIHMDQAGIYPFWIGFKNISRSVQASTPPKGKWDERESMVWVNGNVILAPEWKFPGRIPKNLEEPLVDEGYEYRPPTLIRMEKGWNTVLIKLPVGSFKGPWYDPVKWMFTFVPLSNQPKF